MPQDLTKVWKACPEYWHGKLMVPRQLIRLPPYEVSFTCGQGCRMERAFSDVPYICWNVLSGSVLPEAPESIFM